MSSSLSNEAYNLWLFQVAGRNNGNAGLLSASNLMQIPAIANQQHRQHQRDHHETDEVLLILRQSAFNQLTDEEKVKVLQDICCAGSELKEDPEVIRRLLLEFEQEVGRGQYPIYKQALDQDRSYVEDPSFPLMFLRASRHDVKKAVKQMIAFLHQKVKYFGAAKLARDITLNDLSTEDLELMLSGMYHIQDGTDPYGRVILYTLSSNLAEDLNSQIRVMYYIWINILIPMHSVQMKGVVAIHYSVMKPANSDEQTNPGRGVMKRFADFTKSLPIRASAFHLCTKRDEQTIDVTRNTFLQSCVQAMPKYTKERSRVHRGSSIELQYLLSIYGIPPETFPVDAGGNLRKGILNAWFHKHYARQQIDWDNYDSSDEDQPPRPYTDRDVLLGKGSITQNHPGNIAFRRFLDERHEEYDSAPRNAKGEVSKNLTRALKASGVQFLQKTAEDIWEEVSFEDCVKTVSQYMRSSRKKRQRVVVVL